MCCLRKGDDCRLCWASMLCPSQAHVCNVGLAGSVGVYATNDGSCSSRSGKQGREELQLQLLQLP